MDPLQWSRAGEGQLCLVVKDGSLYFLFESKGSLYHGQGFEMLDALTQHCCLDTVSKLLHPSCHFSMTSRATQSWFRSTAPALMASPLNSPGAS
jgi:hypothetical protein